MVRLKGIYPHARYLSITVYDNATGNPLTRIKDVDLDPYPGSVNPFVEGNYMPDQSYELVLLPSHLEMAGFSNVIEFDSSVTNLSVFIRYYLPREDSLGGVNLPQIAAFQPSGEQIIAPEALELSNFISQEDILARIESLKTLLFGVELDSTRQFFRPTADQSGLYANIDNDYLVSPLTLSNNEVVLLRWKAPSVAGHFANFHRDVRYYSLSISDVFSFNYATQSDEQLYIASDGFINLVICKSDSAVMAHSTGLNYLQWPSGLVGDEAILLYRNMLTKPNLDHAITSCTSVTDDILGVLTNPAAFDATVYMGEFAPTGKKMTKQAFFDNFGGIEVSY